MFCHHRKQKRSLKKVWPDTSKPDHLPRHGLLSCCLLFVVIQCQVSLPSDPPPHRLQRGGEVEKLVIERHSSLGQFCLQIYRPINDTFQAIFVGGPWGNGHFVVPTFAKSAHHVMSVPVTVVGLNRKATCTLKNDYNSSRPLLLHKLI